MESRTIDDAQGLLSVLEAYSELLEEHEYAHQQAFIASHVQPSDTGRLVQVESQWEAIEDEWSPTLHQIASIPSSVIERFFLETPELAPYRRMVRNIRRTHKETTSILSGSHIQVKRIHDELVHNDFTFKPIGTILVGHATIARLLEHPARDVREKAYAHYYRPFIAHKETLTAILRMNLRQQIMFTRMQEYSSTRTRILDSQEIDESVHGSLTSTIRSGVSSFHAYFSVRRRLLGVGRLKMYDLDVPLMTPPKMEVMYDEAVRLICASCSMLGSEFSEVLGKGLLAQWVVDKARPGTYTVASYVGGPKILLNYSSSVLQNLFTLAHEAGHAMHAWYSIRHNRFCSYEFSILESETVAAVHEELLANYLLAQFTDLHTRAYLLERVLLVLTRKLMRQTLLTEFEHTLYTMEEAEEPLTMEAIATLYGELLTHYLGPEVDIQQYGNLEWLTVEHLYLPYYMYTYPVGASGAMGIANDLLAAKEGSVERYLGLLGSGGSRRPVESLSDAGAAIMGKDIFLKALQHYDALVAQYIETVKELGLY
jgi:oligoendopeptidase F